MNKFGKQKLLVLLMLVIGAVGLMGCQQGEVSNVTIEVTDESGSDLPAQVKLVPEQEEEVTEKVKQKLSKEGTAVQFKNLPTGVYELKVSKEGYLSTSNYLVVKEDNVTKSIKLKEELPTLTVKPMIKGFNKSAAVEIFESGEKVASQEGANSSFRLEPGIYKIKVKKDDYLTTSKYISLEEDDDLIKNIKLLLDAPTLTVKPMLGGEAGQAEVEILQDGEKITSSEGKTVEFRLKKGIYTVRVSKEGYQTTTKYLMVEDSGAEVTLKLQKDKKKKTN